MTDELKSCANCGNAEIKPMHVCNSNRPLYRVKCYKCGMQMNLDDKDKVIAAWNTRHTPCDLSSIDNISLMAESVRRGLATVESDTLPSWVIDVINHMIDTCNIKNEDYALGYLAALDDVLYLRKPEGK